MVYTLTATASPNDGGVVKPESRQYPEGSLAAVSADANSDGEYEFLEWTGDIENGEFFESTGKAVFTVVMDSDKNVVANFVKKSFPLNILVEGEGTVNEKVIKAGVATDYTSGTVVELTAIAEDEWEFKEWKGDVTGNKNPEQITIDKAKTVTAVFVKKQYPLTIEIEGEGTVLEKVIKAGVATDYNSGTIVELTAEPTGDSEFVEWQGDVTGNENPVQITIDKAKTVKAVFNKNPIYLDDNGITIKAKDWAKIGDKGTIQDVVYTIVDETTLRLMIDRNEDVTKVVTTRVTDMRILFLKKSSFNQDIGSWDTSSVKYMGGMFQQAIKFNQDIGSWNVSNVTDMKGMFNYAVKFNKNIGNWDVSNVTDMSVMFRGAGEFNQDIGSWNTSSVRDMRGMFEKAYLFNQDIGGWDTSIVTDMSYMFYSAYIFNKDIGGWDTSSVTDMRYMFTASEFNQDIGGWDTSIVTNMKSMFGEAKKFNQDIGAWDVSNVKDMEAMFALTDEFNQDIGDWDTSNVNDMSYMFYQAEDFNQDIGDWDTSMVNNMVNMFKGTKEFDQDIGNWDVSNVTGMQLMFYENTAFNKDLSKWCVEKIESIPDRFATGSVFETKNHPVWGTCPD
jgi:surface protein